MPEWLASIRNTMEGTYTLRIAEDFFSLLLTVGPYLLVALALNVLVARFMRHRTIRFSVRNEIVAILTASFVGLLSPLPTYAAIPIGLSLLPTGVPFSAVLAFVIASPLMNPTVFFLTATQIGMEMAVMRTFTAYVLGCLAGIIAMTGLKTLHEYAAAHTPCVVRRDKTVWQEVKGNALYMAKYFSMALLLSAVVKALVPPAAISRLLGADARFSTLAAIALGVPCYACGGAAIPFIETLHEMGMSKGAMLAFFLAGPATKLETLYAFKSMLGSRVLWFYLILTFLFAYIAGMIYSFF